MNRTLRGAWARRGTLLPLMFLTAVVVAGVVAVISLAEGSGTSPAVAVPLLALGLVAVPDSGRQLAAMRRPEIAVARLRGVTGGQLAVTLAVEPFMVLVLGSMLGLALGVVVAQLADTFGLSAESTLTVTVLPAVALVVVFGLVAVLVGMAGALREPLADQVGLEERPRSASTMAIFGSVLVLAAAVVATYRSSVVDAQDPGWVVLAGPALVGLALGQVTVWLVRLVAAAGVRWTSWSRLPGFLAVRRLARTGAAVGPLRLVVAAAVLAGVALTGAQQIGQWSEETARMRAGAPYQITLENADVQEALSLTRDRDPEGKWLMAAAVVPDEGSVPDRRAFLDVARYDAVVGDFFDDTPASGISDRIATLAPEDAASVATGDTVTASARGVSRRLRGDLRPRVEVDYVDPSGHETSIDLELDVATDGAPDRAERRLTGCGGGCTVTAIVLRRTPGDERLPYVVTGLDFGGLDLLDHSWRSTGRSQSGAAAGPVEVDDGLMMVGAPAAQEAVSGEAERRTPILATDSAGWDGPPVLDSPGGDDRPAKVILHLPALPLVEADGVLADLPRAAAGAPPTVPAAEVMVLAASDTPQDVLDAVADEPGAQLRSLADIEAATDVEAGAARANVYALMAVFCLIVALLVLASAISRQRAVHRREVAALRVVGVGFAEARRSARWEIGALAFGAVVATVLGGIAGVVLLLGNLSLVKVPLHSVPLDLGIAALPLAVSALVAGTLVVLVGGRGRSMPPEQTQPALLREEV